MDLLPLLQEWFHGSDWGHPAWWWLILAIGLVVGSFLNVVIHRLPIMLDREWQMEIRYFLGNGSEASGAQPVHTSGPFESAESQSPAAVVEPIQAALPIDPADRAVTAETAEVFNLAWPPSHCPSCQRRVRFWENIPVLSWLLLRARCPGCKAAISWRYPLIEVLTGVLFLMTFMTFGMSLELLAAWIFTAFLISASAIDADTTLLPDQLTLPLLWLGLLVNTGGMFTDLESAVWGAVGGYLVLWFVYHGFRLLTGKEGMGFGDFKLLAALGAWMGWMMLPIIILLSATVAAVVGLILILALGRDRNLPIPFGPYLAAAGWITLMYGESLRDLLVLG